MSELSVEGLNVHCRETGQGAPVLLLHSGASTGAQWRDVVGELAGSFRLVTMDLHGYGGTGPWPDDPARHTLAEEAALVSALLAHIGEPAHLVGHSYGGGIALELLRRDSPALRSLTLIEPYALSLLAACGEAALHNEVHTLARTFMEQAAGEGAEVAWQTYLDYFNRPGFWQRLGPGVRGRFIEMTPTMVAAWRACLRQELTPEDCAAVAVPTLCLRGEATGAAYGRMTELLAQHIPDAQLQVLPGAGHMSPLTHPQAVAQALAAHFAGR